MSSDLYLAFGLIFVSMIVARLISINAIKQLSENQKSEFLKSFSWVQLYNLIGIVILVASYFWLSSGIMNHTPSITLILYGTFAALFLIGINFWGRTILKKKNFPDSYINKYILSSAIRIIGLAIAFYIIINIS